MNIDKDLKKIRKQLNKQKRKKAKTALQNQQWDSLDLVKKDKSRGWETY